MSSCRVVWEDILHVALAMVSDGGRTGDFELSPLLNFEYWVLYFNREVLKSTSEHQSVLLWVGTVRSVRVAQTVVHANVAQTERLIKRVRLIGYQGKARERPAHSRSELLRLEVMTKENRGRRGRVESQSGCVLPEGRLDKGTQVVKLRVAQVGRICFLDYIGWGA